MRAQAVAVAILLLTGDPEGSRYVRGYEDPYVARRFSVALADGRIDSVVRAEMARQKIPGVAVAVVHKGQVVTAQGYGLANVEHQVPVRAETIFQSGSLGKQFTSAAVMLLVEDGKLALDDAVTKYFADAPGSWKPITVRHLLTHTSGIPDYTGQSSLDLRRDYSEGDLVKLAYGLKLEFPPGSRWNYSNTGYVLLGVLIHRVSGQFYGDVLRDRVFEPLGMTTARIISESDIVPNRSGGYRLVRGELKNQDWVSPLLNTTADGALYFSVLDLVAWDKGIRSQAVLKPASWTQVFEPATLTSGKTYPYGFGWTIDDRAGQRIRRHGGAWQGFQTHLARFLGDDLTVIALSNLAQSNPEAIVDGIAARFNPALTRREPEPIPDREPAIAAHVKSVLASASRGELTPEQFAYVRAGFFPDAPKRIADLLRPLGEPIAFTLLERRELGDDRIYTYDVAYPSRVLRVTFGLAPDDKISSFGVRPR